MVIKNLENKVKLVTIICGFFLLGCILISVSSIWTARTMVVDIGRQCAHLGATYYDGGNPRCGSQKPCRDVPPLSLHMFFIGINKQRKEYINTIYQCFIITASLDDRFSFSLNWVNFVTLFVSILLL